MLLGQAGKPVADDAVRVGDELVEAAHPHIALTTIDQDGTVMGRTAARLLLERIEGRTSAVHFSVVPSLVVRGSTAPPGT